MPSHAETVVLLTTWNRPALLRQSLPQIEREAARIGASLVICDDQSANAETLGLLHSASDRGADLIRRRYVRSGDAGLEETVHLRPQDALRRLVGSPAGADIVRHSAQNGRGGDAVIEKVVELWDRQLGTAHVSAQRNNLFGFRHVLATHPGARFVLKVDDDVVLARGAFETMLAVWDRASQDAHDVLAVSGIRTVNERPMAHFDGYTITSGVCNVAVLYQRVDWERMLAVTPDRVSIRDGFDLAFAWRYAPRYRPSAVAVSVAPSVVYHTGLNGLHVRNRESQLRVSRRRSLRDCAVISGLPKELLPAREGGEPIGAAHHRQPRVALLRRPARTTGRARSALPGEELLEHSRPMRGECAGRVNACEVGRFDMPGSLRWKPPGHSELGFAGIPADWFVVDVECLVMGCEQLDAVPARVAHVDVHGMSGAVAAGATLDLCSVAQLAGDVAG
jgi:hypothetical protein